VSAPPRLDGASAFACEAAASRWSGGGRIWLAAVAGLALALGASVSAPAAASTALRLALVQAFGTGDIAVRLETRPAPALWWGNIGALSIAAQGVRVGRLDVARFDAVLTHVAVDPGLLYGRRRLEIRSIGGGVARVTVTAENLARLVAAEPAVKRVAVRLEPGTIMLDGTVTVLGAEFPASLAGHLAVRDGTHLDLVVDRLTVMNGLPLPPDATSRVAASINPVLDVGRLPFDLRLTHVAIGRGVVTLQAAAGASP
jgi:hypothetical protein